MLTHFSYGSEARHSLSVSPISGAATSSFGAAMIQTGLPSRSRSYHYHRDISRTELPYPYPASSFLF